MSAVRKKKPGAAKPRPKPARKARPPAKAKAKPKAKSPAPPAHASGRRILLQQLLRMFGAAVLVALLATAGWVAVYRFVNPPVTLLMLLRQAEADPGQSVTYTWRGKNEISRDFAVAVLAAEDQRFPSHSGFDLVEMRKAMAAGGGRMRGASTLTQQVAKNAFLWPARSWLRKGLEAYFTVLIEALWSKERILEVYMNIAETGPGLFGAEAAARHYYKKPAASLTPDEAAWIAAVLPNPRQYSPAKPTDYLRARQKWIRQQMTNLGGPKFLENLRDR